MCVHEHMCVHMHLHVCAHEYLCVLFQGPAEVLMVTTLAGTALRAGIGAQVGDCRNTGHPLGNRLEGHGFCSEVPPSSGPGLSLFFSSHTGLGPDSEWTPDWFVLQGLAAAHWLLLKSRGSMA